MMVGSKQFKMKVSTLCEEEEKEVGIFNRDLKN